MFQYISNFRTVLSRSIINKTRCITCSNFSTVHITNRNIASHSTFLTKNICYRVHQNTNQFMKINALINVRPFGSKGESDADNNSSGADDIDSVDYQSQLPATVAIPEVWPNLPVIATKRNPIFPRFMKILEVFDCHLMKNL